MADENHSRIRDCANPAILADFDENDPERHFVLEIETAHTFKGMPEAVLIDGVRYEPAHA